MTKLDKAKEYLKSGYSVAILGEEELLSKESGITFIARLANEKRNLKGYVAADKIIGKAAACLYVLLGVEEVYAGVLAKEGAKVLTANHIPFTYGVMADEIINRKGDGLCPMELAVKEVTTPEEAFEAVWKTLANLKKINLLNK